MEAPFEPSDVLLARLKSAPAHLAASEFQQYIKSRIKPDGFFDGYGVGLVDREVLEKTLVARGEPLIDLAIAAYGSSKEVVSKLYFRALAGTGDPQQDMGVRLAVLANRVLPQPFFEEHPALNADELRRLAVSGTDSEITTLFTNPLLRKYLAKLYQLEPPFDGLEDARFCALVHASVKNPRLNADDGGESGPDLNLMGLQKGIYKLLQSVPVNRAWHHTLSYLLHQVDPRQATYGDEGFSEILERWKGLRLKKLFERDTDEEEEGWLTELSAVEEFRCQIAALYGCTLKDAKPLGRPSDEDVALRCAYYGNANLKPKEMDAGYTKDGETFVFAALSNDSLYFDKTCRAKLEEMIAGYAINRYAKRCKQIAARRAWFDPRPLSETGVNLLAGVTPPIPPEMQALERLEAQLGALQKQFAKAITWVLWGLVIVAILALRH